MIMYTLFKFATSIISGFFSVIGSMVTLPVQLIATLSTITGYGSWVLGSDLLILFTASVIFWTTVKCSVGVAVWLWKLLPLT